MYSTIKMAPTQSSLKKNKVHVYNIMDKWKSLKPKFKIVDLVRTAGWTNFFVKMTQQFGAINYIQLIKLLIILFSVIVFNFLPERYNEALLKKS